MIALIDADIVAYRCASSNNIDEPGALEIVLLRADKLMHEILYAVDAKHYKAFLTGSDNFRKKIYPEYKANRKDTEKPIHLQSVREFLVSEWKAEICNGYEADDALGMEQAKAHTFAKLLDPPIVYQDYTQDKLPNEFETIICTIDKDLDMIPGLHYNFVKGELYEVSEIQAIRFFYKQLLIGDRSDNIIGVHGIGPKKAAQLIDSLDTEEEMYEVVKELYDDNERLCTNMQCLWIWR